MIKSKNHDFSSNSGNKKAETGFLTLEARLPFTQLRQAFIEALIFDHFDAKRRIWIETDISSYAIGGVLSQLSFKTRLDGVVTNIDFGQWHPIAFFSRKMISAKT